MIQAVMIGITGVFLALFLKQTKPEYAVCISVGTGLLLLLLAAGRLSLVVENIRLIQDAISVQSAYIQVLLKIIGITYISGIRCRHLPGRGLLCGGRTDRRLRQTVDSGGQHAHCERTLQTVQNFLGG